MTTVALGDGSRLVVTWHCAVCIRDWPEPFCPECGATLKHERGQDQNLPGRGPALKEEV